MLQLQFCCSTGKHFIIYHDLMTKLMISFAEHNTVVINQMLSKFYTDRDSVTAMLQKNYRIIWVPEVVNAILWN